MFFKDVRVGDNFEDYYCIYLIFNKKNCIKLKQLYSLRKCELFINKILSQIEIPFKNLLNIKYNNEFDFYKFYKYINLD